ncbi:MAG: hypothetical protein SVM80_06825 [Halobacteriota archaeon]|nr:hypothetical protein [Halobacteriota archaeon]
MVKKAPNPIPEGMHTLTTHLWFNGDCREAIRFYKKAFEAEETAPAVETPGGEWHNACDAQDW